MGSIQGVVPLQVITQGLDFQGLVSRAGSSFMRWHSKALLHLARYGLSSRTAGSAVSCTLSRDDRGAEVVAELGY